MDQNMKINILIYGSTHKLMRYILFIYFSFHFYHQLGSNNKQKQQQRQQRIVNNEIMPTPHKLQIKI